jgi:hypothetical protein
MANNTIPIPYDASGLWRIWNYNDLYTGPTGTGQYVPKPNDEVHQIIGNKIYRYLVTSVDPITSLSTLIAVDETASLSSYNAQDVLFGSNSDNFIVFIDTSVTPYRLCIDPKAMVSGSGFQYCKVFKGTDTTTSGTLVSQWYDASNQYVNENIPLELVASDKINNTAIKVAQQAWTTETLADGELLTAVYYTNDETVGKIYRLTVMNSGFVLSANAYAKAVVGISLECSFTSSYDDRVINFPVNVPLTALNLIGVVSFSDGSVRRYGVDGNLFSIDGLQAFAPTTVGQTRELILKYRLQAGEVAFGNTNGANDHFSEEYRLVVVAKENSYAVQLYPYPVWDPTLGAYKLAWFLYTLDRSMKYDVTNLVQINPSVALFNPTGYGIKQTLLVGLNLKDVDASYNSFNHIQYVDILLNTAPNALPAVGANNVWQVSATAGTLPMYGNGVYAVFNQTQPNSFNVKVNGDFSVFEDWLKAFYYNAQPQVDRTVEVSAPMPTHFKITLNGIDTTLPINQWNATIVLSQAMANKDTMYIKFIKRTSTNDLQLVKTALIVWQNVPALPLT